MKCANVLSAALVIGALITPAALAQSATFEAPGRYVVGYPYKVTVQLEPAEDGSFDSLLLGPGGFTLNGKPLTGGKKGKQLQLPPGSQLTVAFDLGPQIAELAAHEGGSFVLAHVLSAEEAEPMTVSVLEAASKDVDYMNIDASELAVFQVLMQTIHGDMLIEFWPDVAPDHVRNFLDLANSGFYEGTLFHRVSPGFMIQGGDPTGTGHGNGPRKVKAEFSDRKHVRGVLSMARSEKVDSASCQFFVMHGKAPALDNKYSVFGKLVDGYEVLDKIASARGVASADRTIRPAEPQRIERAIVVLRAGDRESR